ncbi:uncharacterized protein LOC113852189 [Abrus precatorius]|uniref:Uncharacterized protein LOC113852189 n=1 Tax=Abrus precatorius TaxID=3816 RepID=A0A8B8K3C6_ABRPR|nr:uncharacterized protein LOC113852189 [Abrus precatorius]
MGRQSHDHDHDHDHDPTVFHSSIALLQERFRQLQRVKEMREERELQKMLNEPKQFNSNTTMSYEPTRLLSNPELTKPSRSPPHVSLSLWPTSQVKQEDYTSVQTPVSLNLCPTDYNNYAHSQSLQVSWKNVYDCDSGSDSGVDTSLHL